MIAYTDHHITEFGDKPHLPAPIRQVKVIAFDGAEHLIVDIGLFRFEVRRSNVYKEPGRLSQQPCLSLQDLLMAEVWVPHPKDWEDILETVE